MPHRYIRTTETEAFTTQKGQPYTAARLLFVDKNGELMSFLVYKGEIAKRSAQVEAGNVYDLIGLVWKEFTVAGEKSFRISIAAATCFRCAV